MGPAPSRAPPLLAAAGAGAITANLIGSGNLSVSVPSITSLQPIYFIFGGAHAIRRSDTDAHPGERPPKPRLRPCARSGQGRLVRAVPCGRRRARRRTALATVFHHFDHVAHGFTGAEMLVKPDADRLTAPRWGIFEVKLLVPIRKHWLYHGEQLHGCDAGQLSMKRGHP